jgi:sortase (surface protein transpeptidase)
MLAVVGGAALIVIGLQTRPLPPSLTAPPAAGSVQVPPVHTAAPTARTIPLRVIIPAIGVNAAVTPEGVNAAGALETPPLTAQNLVGWWDGGAAPGQVGPAVIAGHVDNASGPLVFWNLRLLKPGETVNTEPGNLRFVVTRVTQVSKQAFPTDAVYGSTADPELRLVTCGGTFDSTTGHYLSNVIVYAREMAGSN